MLLGLGVFVLFTLLGQFVQVFGELKRTQNLSMGRELDAAIKWLLDIDAIQATTANGCAGS